MGYAIKKAPTRAKAAVSKAVAKPKVLAPTEERPHQQDVMHRLRRVEGQIRGVLAMMEQNQPCDAIAQQLSAARKALDRAFYEMMACSLEMEVNSGGTEAELRERIAEKTRLLSKYA